MSVILLFYELFTTITKIINNVFFQCSMASFAFTRLIWKKSEERQKIFLKSYGTLEVTGFGFWWIKMKLSSDKSSKKYKLICNPSKTELKIKWWRYLSELVYEQSQSETMMGCWSYMSVYMSLLQFNRQYWGDLAAEGWVLL